MTACVMRGVFGIAALSLGGWGGAPRAEAARPWPDSSARIVVFADQLASGMSAEQLVFAATRLAGTQKMTRSDIRALREYKPDFLCLHYQLGLGCGAHNFVVGDDWTNDWATVNAHEDWFLHNASNFRVHQTAWDWDVMDITSPGGAPNTGFPEYWIATALARAATNENDGVFADSFTQDAYTFGQCSPSHEWFEDITLCQNNWIPALHAYADAVKSRFEADGRGILFLPNLGGLITSWDTTDFNRLGHGGMIEGFCFWDGGNYFDPADWELQMRRTTDLARSNKVLLCQTYIGSETNYQDRMFATTSHLLIKGARTCFFMLAGEGLEYYPEYEVNLGRAVADLPADFTNLWYAAWGMYRRDYTNGTVLVNPGESAAAIPSLGGSYWRVSASGGGGVPSSAEYNGSLSFTAVTSLNLAPHSGAILLSSTNAPSGVVGPLITANGLVGEVQLNSGAMVTLAVQMMNIEPYLGIEVDWWVVAWAHSGEWHYLNSARQWLSFSGDLAFCRPVYQGALFTLSSTPVLSEYILPVGTYDFWFAVDYPRDGILDPNGPILFNKASVVVQ